MPMMWPTLTVQDVERSLTFYRDQLGLEQDLDLRDETGALYLASVEVHETVIMLSRANPSTPQDPRRSGVRLTLLFDRGHDIDALLDRLLGRGMVVCSRDWRPAVGPSRFHRVRPRRLSRYDRAAARGITGPSSFNGTCLDLVEQSGGIDVSRPASRDN